MLLNALVPQEPNAIRLMNGRNSTSGRVEVFHDGRWGKVCLYNSIERRRIARIACRQLGLQGENFMIVYIYIYIYICCQGLCSMYHS